MFRSKAPVVALGTYPIVAEIHTQEWNASPKHRGHDALAIVRDEI
jgi:hypothetical protein